MIVQHRT